MNERPEGEGRSRDACREFDHSFHVNYTTDEEGRETENQTHAEVISTDEIEERGDSESGWIGQIEDGRLHLLVSTATEGGWAVDQKLTAETCAQLGHFFFMASVALRLSECERLREEVEMATLVLDETKRQQTLPLEGTEWGPEEK